MVTAPVEDGPCEPGSFAYRLPYRKRPILATEVARDMDAFAHRIADFMRAAGTRWDVTLSHVALSVLAPEVARADSLPELTNAAVAEAASGSAEVAAALLAAVAVSTGAIHVAHAAVAPVVTAGGHRNGG